MVMEQNLKRWRKAARERDEEFVRGSEHKPVTPSSHTGKYSASCFKDYVVDLVELFLRLTNHVVRVEVARKSAIILVQHNVCKWQDIAHVCQEEVNEWFCPGPTHDLMQRIWPVAQREADMQLRKELAERRVLDQVQIGKRINLSRLADTLCPEAMALMRAEAVNNPDMANLSEMGKALRPKKP